MNTLPHRWQAVRTPRPAVHIPSKPGAAPIQQENEMTSQTKFTVGEYMMQNGRDAIVCAVNSDGVLIGAFLGEDGDWIPTSWSADGRWMQYEYSGEDLMLPLRECWRIDNSGLVFDTREKAQRHASCLWVDGAPADFTISKYREVRDDKA